MSVRRDRQDWALLLPSSIELPVVDAIVLGGTEAAAQALVDQGVARSWRRPADDADRAALTVCRVDCDLPLDDVGRHVANGGAMVIEVDRHQAGRRLVTAQRISRILARRALGVHSIHLVEPSFDEPGRYLPLDAPRALRWYLHNVFIAGTPALRAASAAAGLAARTTAGRAALAAAAPRMLIVAVSPERRVGPAAPAPIGVPAGRPGDSAVLLVGGHDAGSRAVLMVFGRRDRRPRSVTKVASRPASAEATRGEHDRLRQLHDELPLRLRAALPVPLAVASAGGRLACTQSCAQGPSMSAVVGRWARPHHHDQVHFENVNRWLTDFALATRTPTHDAASAWHGVFADVRTELVLRPAVIDLLDAGAERSVASGLALQAVHQHYDTGPWNVHLEARGPLLVDWERDAFRPADSLGPPLADALYLATYWYFLAHEISTDADEERALVHLFATALPVDADVLAVRRGLDRMLLALGLDRSSVPAALVAMWAERALYTRRRRLSQGDSSTSAHDIRPLAYLDVLAATPELFGGDGWWALPVGEGGGGLIREDRRLDAVPGSGERADDSADERQEVHGRRP